MSSGGDFLRTSYIEPSALGLVLATLTEPNRLVVEVMLATGLRVSDVLNLKTEQVKRGQRLTVRERKTGKSKRVYIPRTLWQRLLAQAGRLYVFEGRRDWRVPRTRQAVWRDLKRAQGIFGGRSLDKGVNLGTHTARKVYAVEDYRRSGSLQHTGQALNHSAAHVATTMIYALADKPELLRGLEEKPKKRR